MATRFKQVDQVGQVRDKETRDYMNQKESDMIKKMEELLYKIDQLSEKVKHYGEDGSSMERSSTRIRPSIVAAPIQI